jgi:triacylglycerol lipase
VRFSIAELSLLLALVLAPAILALVLRALKRRRPPRVPKRPPRLQHPIVLAHGLMGFDQVRLGGKTYEYFRGVPHRLRSLGAEVHVLRLAPTAGFVVRGRQLAEAIRRLDSKRVNIVAHSMGGLDARYAIAKLDIADRVVSLTTIGTPHHGTPLADLTTCLVGELLGLRKMFELLGIDINAFYDMTTQSTDAFNREIADVSGIAYGSFIGVVGKRLSRANPLLVPAYMYLSQRVGANDGLVPASSQHWGEIYGSVEADHWAQIGLSRRFDAPAFYADLLRELRGRGF